MKEKENFKFHEELLSLKKYDFRLLSMNTILADSNRVFRGTLSELCKELDIQSSSANKNTMKKNLNNLAAANLVNIMVDSSPNVLHIVSPYAVCLNDNNYYLVSYNSKYAELRHYRIDKMRSIKILSIEREGMQLFRNFNLAEYSKKPLICMGDARNI